MFELGRDLRKLFAQARESEDLTWLELIGVDLLAVEARQQTTDAGRVSCARPHAAALRASALWREHGRRAGDPESVSKAMGAADDARKAARSPDGTARADLEAARGLMLRFDLCGGPEMLDEALALVPATGRSYRGDTAVAIAGLSARIHARKARLGGDGAATAEAASLMDLAVRALNGRSDGDGDDLKLERAGMALEIGVAQRDPRRLDQAGQALQRLVAAASPDYRPLTRARALTLCGAGLCALAALAHDAEARDQGRLMFDAAADQFTPDHSPMDWVAIQMVRAGGASPPSLDLLVHAEDLTAGRGLTLGALAREMRFASEIERAAAMGDVAMLSRIEARLRNRLSARTSGSTPLDWAADQVSMARAQSARAILTGSDTGALRMALIEAAATARECGAPSIAGHADHVAARLPARV